MRVILASKVFLGDATCVRSHVLGQLGTAAGVTTTTTLLGIIWDDAEPQFNNYSYRYKVQHMHVAAKGKLLVDMGYWVMPCGYWR